MTIYPLSGASWPAKQHSSSAMDEAFGHGRRPEMQTYPSSLCRGSPRQWELRRIASLPVLDADEYWSDASLSLPHLASALPQAVEEKERPPALLCFSRSEDANCRCSATRMGSQESVEEPVKATTRRSTFPPPLDSPAHLSREGRYPQLQTVKKMRFTSVRSNGRLIVTETPIAAEPGRCFRAQRCNGRLVLQLYVESNSKVEAVELEGACPLAAETGGEGGEPISTECNPNAEKVRLRSPFAQGVKESAEKANNEDDEEGEVQVAAEEDEYATESGEKLVNGKVSLYTKVLKTLECDAFSDSTEAFNPINQLQLKYARSSGVASFLHKSLTRVRPLNMLTIWQS